MKYKLATSHSRMTALHTCAKRYKAEKIDKSIPYEQSSAAQRGEEMHLALENAVKEGKRPNGILGWAYDQLPKDQILIPEMALNFSYDWERCSSKPWEAPDCGILVRGSADVVAIDYPNLSATIFDYKTGKTKYGPEQLHLMAGLVSLLLPEIKHYRGAYVKIDGRRQEDYDIFPADIAAALQKVPDAINEETERRANNRWEPKRNDYCRFCKVIDCELKV